MKAGVKSKGGGLSMLERTSKPGWERFEQGFLALCVFLAVPIGLLLSFSYEPGIRFLVAISTSLFLLGLAYSLHARSLHSRQAYLPGLRWLTSTALLALLVLLEICTTPLLLAFVFHPCSAFDLLRRANGCAARLPQASTVVSVSLSGDGSTLATADLEGAVSVWSYPDLIPVRTFKDRWPGIVRVALSAGGDRIAVGGHAPSISVLEPQTGELLYTLDEADTAVLFTHGGEPVLLSLAESAVKVWDAESGDLVRSLPHAGVEHLTVASDGGSSRFRGQPSGQGLDSQGRNPHHHLLDSRCARSTHPGAGSGWRVLDHRGLGVGCLYGCEEYRPHLLGYPRGLSNVQRNALRSAPRPDSNLTPGGLSGWRDEPVLFGSVRSTLCLSLEPRGPSDNSDPLYARCDLVGLCSAGGAGDRLT